MRGRSAQFGGVESPKEYYRVLSFQPAVLRLLIRGDTYSAIPLRNSHRQSVIDGHTAVEGYFHTPLHDGLVNRFHSHVELEQGLHSPLQPPHFKVRLEPQSVYHLAVEKGG